MSSTWTCNRVYLLCDTNLTEDWFIILGTGLTFMNINTHLINSIIIMLDLFLSATPMRIQHVYQAMIFSVTYIIFTFFYWLAGGTDHKNNKYVYRELDYDYGFTKPMLFTFGMVCVAIPVIFCLLIWLTKVRSLVYNVCYRKSGKRTSNIILDEAERGLLYANTIIWKQLLILVSMYGLFRMLNPLTALDAIWHPGPIIFIINSAANRLKCRFNNLLVHTWLKTFVPRRKGLLTGKTCLVMNNRLLIE